VASDGLTVTVTGPTGDLGIALVSALDRSRRVKKIVGMARRPFDPRAQGWKKVEYRQGDVQDRAGVRDAVKGADAVVHLAFAIIGAGKQSHAINVEGSRVVFEESIAAGAERICYASSVAAYGFHSENPKWLTEDVQPRGTPEHYYSQQKAEVEGILASLLLKTERTSAYVFRPCIVAGPRAQMLLEQIPYYRLGEALPDPVRRLLSSMPVLKPVIPDIGVPFQFVHEDDVASAFVAGALGRGSPGPYNLAGNGTLKMADVADELGWYAIPVPDSAAIAAAEVVGRIPSLPEAFAWIHTMRQPVLMKTDRARKELGWKPKYTSRQTLKALVAAYRDQERFRD
jgi:nucleoside-diphosphate-sugar epimerase